MLPTVNLLRLAVPHALAYSVDKRNADAQCKDREPHPIAEQSDGDEDNQ